MLKRTGFTWSRVAVGAGMALVLLAAGTHVLAAPSQDGAGIQGQTVLDPFSLTSVAVSAMSEGQTVDLSGSRPSIRIPHRPSDRSAFRPMY